MPDVRMHTPDWHFSQAPHFESSSKPSQFLHDGVGVGVGVAVPHVPHDQPELVQVGVQGEAQVGLVLLY